MAKPGASKSKAKSVGKRAAAVAVRAKADKSVDAKPKSKLKPAAAALPKPVKPKTAAPKVKAAPPAKAKATPKTASPKAKAPPRPKGAEAPKAAPAPEPSRAPPGAADFLAALSPEHRDTLETLSRNLARASFTAQAAMTQAGMSGAGKPMATDPFHVGPALGEVATKLAASPERLMKAQTDLFERYMELWSSTTKRMTVGAAETATPPASGKVDKRFKDAAWSENPVFDAMEQSYLLTSDWLNGLVGGVEGVDPMTKRRVEFFTKMLTDAFSPSNFLFSNPVALKAMQESGGESLVKGAERFAADLARGGGQLSIAQTDFSRFKVGENVATAPGKVVFENKLFQLLQFSASTEQVHEIPLLIFPPWINKYYILDLRPENSMIRWLTAQGFTVFVTSWVNPAPELAGMTLLDYMRDGAYTAVEKVLQQTGAKTTSTVGYCIGGTLLGCTLAHMAARGDERISAATFFAAQQDFTEAGDLLLFTNDAWLEDLSRKMDEAGGVLPGQAMADTFNALRANDLIWSFFVNNYLLGKEPAAFDLLFWNADQTRMPKTLHMSYLDDFYKSNRLSRGELVLDGVTLDLRGVKTPVYVQSSRDDHIAPMRSVYRGAKLFGGPTTFTLSGSGHIAGVINAPVAMKYQHWVNPKLPATVDEWLAETTEHAGSWWPHWEAWLAERSGPMVKARDPAKGPLKPIEDAPGRYVKVRSDTAEAA
ncbi:class I poly(R)-hydroxyalkanoic acid synthase [soil metagenome]